MCMTKACDNTYETNDTRQHLTNKKTIMHVSHVAPESVNTLNLSHVEQVSERGDLTRDSWSVNSTTKRAHGERLCCTNFSYGVIHGSCVSQTSHYTCRYFPSIIFFWSILAASRDDLTWTKQTDLACTPLRVWPMSWRGITWVWKSWDLCRGTVR